MCNTEYRINHQGDRRMKNKTVSYKGFDKELKCRGYQYEIGKTFNHEGKVQQCQSGFHACPAPINVFNYYAPADSRYCVVEQSGDLSENDDKVASSVLTVKAEINTFDIVKAQIEWVKSKLIEGETESNTGDYSAASNTGNYSAASNTGDYSAASNTGDYSAASNTGDYSAASNAGDQSAASNTGNQSAASNTGDYSAASNTGDYSAASNTGNRSAASNTGYQSAASNTGDYSAVSNTGNRSAASNTGNRSAASNTGNYSAASNTGYQSAASNTGDYSAASVEGEKSVAIVTGYDSKAKASEGSWVVITERNDDYEIINIKTAKAGVDIEPDTYYKVVDGEFVKCEEG